MPSPLPAPADDRSLPAAPADAELAARVRGGDGLAFELIMRRHNRRLFRLARSLVRGDAEAEDVVQEAYVRAYARLGDLADGQALAAWLARIVANEALGRLRAAAHIVSLDAHRARACSEEEDGAVGELASDQPGPERLAASSELRRVLEIAVDALPEDFRAVFVLREVEGLSTAETAASLAIRPETVKTRLHRARRLLQEALGDQLLALSPCLFEFDGGRCDRVVAQVMARLDREPHVAPAAAPVPSTPSIPAGRSGSAPLRQPWLARLLAYLERWRRA